MREAVEREVLVMFKEEVVVLPAGRTEARLAEITMPPVLRTQLHESGVEELRRGFPDFQKADTLRVLADGRLFRLPDFSNLLVVTVPSGTDREALGRADESNLR